MKKNSKTHITKWFMVWRKWGALRKIILRNWNLSQTKMAFIVISKSGKFSIFESNAKVNAKYYCNVLLKNLISEMNRLVKQNEYLFTQGWARAHTAKLTLDRLKEKKQEPQITGAPSLATEHSKLESSRFWDLGILRAKRLSRPKNNRSRFLERNNHWRVGQNSARNY